jgi:hypothetical protein
MSKYLPPSDYNFRLPRLPPRRRAPSIFKEQTMQEYRVVVNGRGPSKGITVQANSTAEAKDRAERMGYVVYGVYQVYRSFSAAANTR